MGANFAKRPITDLLTQVNEKDVAEILIFSEIILKDIYDYLANSQTIDNIVLDDVILSNWGTIDEPYKAYYGIIYDWKLVSVVWKPFVCKKYSVL